MPFPTTTPEVLSSAESEALGRFVHDIRTRMSGVVQLLQERGSPEISGLADSIADRLSDLEHELQANSAR
jgi:hypothetical protein